MIREKDTPKTWSRKRKTYVILSLIILIAIIVFVFFKSCSGQSLFCKPKPTPVYLEDDSSSLEGEAEQADIDEMLAGLEKQQLIVTDKLSSNITFESGTVGTIGEWTVENSADNTVVMQAQVYMDEVLIAKSTPIYPDQHITGIELLEEVETGEYEVTAYLDYYDLETKEFISKAGYRIHLTVN